MKCSTCKGEGVIVEKREVDLLGFIPLWDETVTHICSRCNGSGEEPEVKA